MECRVNTRKRIKDERERRENEKTEAGAGGEIKVADGDV